jgi:hypothetical protein
MFPPEVESRQEEDDLLKDGVAVPVPRIVIFMDQSFSFPLFPGMRERKARADHTKDRTRKAARMVMTLIKDR